MPQSNTDVSLKRYLNLSYYLATLVDTNERLGKNKTDTRILRNLAKQNRVKHLWLRFMLPPAGEIPITPRWGAGADV